MRNTTGDTRRAWSVNSTLDTIHAAATAIAAIDDRDHPATPVQKRRWSGCLSLYWCFGSCKHQTRIGHAIFVPETTNLPSNASAIQNHTQSTTIMLPFIAPPSSPASFFQSEPPSVTQSPTGLLSTSVSASMFSPGGPHSIFAIGPYANETQLVSPPVFSPFQTEPSTAPFTPPPESVHLTTPSSPEVPFATTNGGFPFSHYEFPSYQLSPGSPIGHLISPGSVISGSGTSSPFPGREFTAIDPNFLDFLANGTPKLLELEKQWSSRCESASLTPSDAAKVQPQDQVSSETELLEDCLDKNSNGLSNRRVSFELPEEPGRATVTEAASSIGSAITGRENECKEGEDGDGTASIHAPEKLSSDNNEKKRHHFRRRSITLGSSREFDFDNVDGDESTKPRCANEKVAEDNGAAKNWSFPVIQSSVS